MYDPFWVKFGLPMSVRGQKKTENECRRGVDAGAPVLEFTGVCLFLGLVQGACRRLRKNRNEEWLKGTGAIVSKIAGV